MVLSRKELELGMSNGSNALNFIRLLLPLNLRLFRKSLKMICQKVSLVVITRFPGTTLAYIVPGIGHQLMRYFYLRC